MNGCFILIGRLKVAKEGNPFVALYVGPSGVELNEKAKQAAGTKEYAQVVRLSSQTGSPMAIEPVSITSSTPKFPRHQRKQEAKPAQETHLDRITNAERQRRQRLSASKPAEQGKPKEPAKPLESTTKEIVPGKGETATHSIPVGVPQSEAPTQQPETK